MYIIIINVMISFLYIFIRTRKNIHILQQNFYNENNRYIKWGKTNIENVYKLDYFIFLIALLNILINNKILIIFNIGYLFLTYIEYIKINNEQVKIPLKVTSRVKRLSTTITLLYIIPLIVYLLIHNIFIFNLLFTLSISFNFYIVFVANIINKPIEKCVFLFYRNKAIKKLKSMNNLEIVGITGSYGKTSSKNILNDILSVKFNSLPTPANYNTQYGLILTINNNLDKFNDIFIAEMGAFKMGRIKLLCDLVHPKYGIITCIGKAHLETFKSQENIQKGKFELIESLPVDGIGILNMDDPLQVNYKLKNKIRIIWIAINNKNADVKASNIKIDQNGMSFDVSFKDDEKSYLFRTKLLGNSNIYNILAGIAFSKYVMNMDIKDIQTGVRRIKPISHRLELKTIGNKTYIDDAYNSNPVGSKMALDVLNLMDGNKIVVTPGMIELGEEEYKLNKLFGNYISKVADYVILVGEKQTKPIMDGLLEKKYDTSKVRVINNVKESFNIIDNLNLKKKHTYILLENDLPDIFNE